MPHTFLDRLVSPRGALLFTLTLVVAASWARPATAQAPQPAFPFEAKVIENTVMVRSGAGRAYYEVGQLQRGDFVTVEDELFGWYKIECPAGVFCFVDRKNVDARGDGSLGIVNTDATAVNAAHATKGPADSYRKLGDLETGDEVQIVATVNNAYKILPPDGTYVFLPPKSIEAVTEEEPQTPEAPAAPETPTAPEPQEPAAPEPTPPPVVEVPEPSVVVTPVVPEPVQPVEPTPPVEPEMPEPAPVAVEVEVVPEPDLPAVTEVTFEEPAAAVPATDTKVDLLNDPDANVPLPDVPVSTQASNELLRAVEVAILPYFTLPVDQQPIAKMVRGYADAAQIEGLSDNDLTIIRTRLTELERNRTIAQTMQDIDDTNLEVNDGQAVATAEESATPEPVAEAPAVEEGETVVEVSETAEAVDTPETPAAPAVPATDYDAVGILSASTVHTGGNQPQLFRLLDPTGRRTIAYLEPGDQIDTVQMIGRLVGIVGESAYDPSTKLNLIQPERIDILNAR